ncbi:MAG TPA: ubiquinone/menaquinone biosynthesis methyltransferase UbiE [Desulfobacter sp.]|jgi:ubiquinone/menaquinone biosynthesis C-methylase UbiE|uniref:class I SAM-dependent methyltransferase n=2 Tax=unclassified Desulfobacter TaxID=2634406 RepID=UPI000E9474F9|nr:methyltransferase domain-containing protein [Desulfobacter sp. UBA2225]MBP9599807.1 methyltransferase domain-containing protein [Desulfobacter sp.]HAR34690.1 ubiquinone/menaquinone biosynthesis methyltransferase UbiE [Desulfobacter sp.]HRF91209.1 methyltransferase domain-containing protein [Desulfobacter postgatei]
MDQAKPKGAGKSSFELIDTQILEQMLPIHKGSVILDLACGKGLYSLFLSQLSGPSGLVYAVDLWEEGLEILEQDALKKEAANILTIKADATREIDIEAHSLDLCLMATVLHDFKEMNADQTVLKQVLNLLIPGGCLAVIEFKKMDGPPGPPAHIRLSQEETEKLVTGVGFKKINTTEIGDYNYLTTFKSPM